MNKIKLILNKHVRKYIRFRNYLPNFKFGRNISEILLEHIEPYRYMDEWRVKPFNGQSKRLVNICLICNAFKPDYCIETGTYIGTTTTLLAGLSTTKTYTFEINQKSALQAKKRFSANYPNLKIECVNANSVDEMPKILSTIKSEMKIFAYLDSHWLHEVPTSQEIKILSLWGNNWVAVIDDFRVDHDLGYGFDQYRNIVVGQDVVPQISGLQIWVPKEKSEYETGARRGTGYIFTETSAKLMTPELMQNLVQIR